MQPAGSRKRHRAPAQPALIRRLPAQPTAWVTFIFAPIPFLAGAHPPGASRRRWRTPITRCSRARWQSSVCTHTYPRSNCRAATCPVHPAFPRVPRLTAGAGPGGIYSALRLVDTGTVAASDICIFEMTGRVGGRIMSLRGLGPDQDLVVDVGAYRSWPEYTPITHALITQCAPLREPSNPQSLPPGQSSRYHLLGVPRGRPWPACPLLRPRGCPLREVQHRNRGGVRAQGGLCDLCRSHDDAPRGCRCVHASPPVHVHMHVHMHMHAWHVHVCTST